MAPFINYILWARRLARVENTVSGYPRFEQEALRKDHEGPETSHEDYKRYSRFNTQLNGMQLFIILWCLVEVVKDFYMPIYSLTAFKLMNSTQHETEVACLKTNCTKLTPNGNIKQELVHLPLFVICHPRAKLFYNPLIALDEFGLIIHTALAYLGFVLGVVVPVAMYFRPSPQGVVIFLLSSTPWPRKECELIRKCLRDVYVSLLVFFEDRKFCRKRYRASGKDRYIFSEFDEPLIRLEHEKDQVKKLSRDFSLLDYETKGVVQDCLPLVRLQRWRSDVAEQYCKSCVLIATYFFTGFALYLMSFLHTYANRIEQLKEIERFIASMQCSMWRYYDETRQSVQMHRLLYESFAVGAAQSFSVVFLVMAVVVSADFALLLITIQELNIAIVETSDRLRLTLEFANNFMFMDSTHYLSNHSEGSGSSFNFRQLRTTQYDNLDSMFGLKYLKPIKLSRFLFERALLEHLLDPPSNIRILNDLLVKTYVSNRMLGHLANEASSSLSVILPFCYITCYGVGMTLLVINRLFFSTSSTPYLYFIIACGMIAATNSLLLAAARIQAKSKTMLTLIWQLVAATTYSDNLQIEHMRTLWVKQAQSMTLNGGLTVTALGVPVTHSSVIQMILASSTLTLYAFGQN